MDNVEVKAVGPHAPRTFEVWVNGSKMFTTGKGRKAADSAARAYERNSMRVTDAPPALQAWCAEMSAKYEGLGREPAYQTWRKYSRECDLGDQSAIFSECEQWYFKGKFPLTEAGKAAEEFDAMFA
jgi:hypothetical protein